MDNLDALFDEFPVLETGRFCLRQIRPTDAPAIFAIFNDPEVTRFYGQPTYLEMSQAEELVARMRQRFAERNTIRWAIACPEEDEVVGTCGFAEWKRHFHCAAIGYELARPYWRHGVMTEVLTAVLNFGFSQMHLNRIEAQVMTGNDASIALLNKLGFREEGILREYGYWQSAFHDLHLLALLKREMRSEK